MEVCLFLRNKAAVFGQSLCANSVESGGIHWSERGLVAGLSSLWMEKVSGDSVNGCVVVIVENNVLSLAIASRRVVLKVVGVSTEKSLHDKLWNVARNTVIAREHK